MLRLPTLQNVNQTLAAWGRELRDSGVVAVGRKRTGIPQFNASLNTFEAVELKDCGSGWQDFEPLIQSGSLGTISNQVVTFARWVQVGQTIHGKLNFSFTSPGVATNDLDIQMPLKIRQFVNEVKVGEGIVYAFAFGRVKATLVTASSGTQTDPVRCTLVSGTNWTAATNFDVFLDFTAEAYYG